MNDAAESNPEIIGVHGIAQRGFTAQAGTYARGRPDYPATLEPWLRDKIGLSPGRMVVDLGAGTGKFTRLLMRSGAEVIAVALVAAMRQQLALTLPATRVLPGTAEAIPLQSASVDAVVCAQASHWFATDAALAEMHRVLRLGGRLGLVWNVREESVDRVAAITAIITPHEGDAPRIYEGDWRRAFSNGRFSKLEQAAFSYEHVGTAQEMILGRFLSVSLIAAPPEETKAAVADQLRILVQSHPALRGNDRIAFPYRTEAYHCTRV